MPERIYPPNIDKALFGPPDPRRLWLREQRATHLPRFLPCYGSVRERSYSRLLETLGGEVRIFDPSGLPPPDDAPDTPPKARELPEPARWAA